MVMTALGFLKSDGAEQIAKRILYTLIKKTAD